MNKRFLPVNTLRITFTFAFILTFLFAFSQHNNISFNNLGINQGLSQSSVVDIAFDTKGFVWLATQDGLNRYDGKDFLIVDKKFDDITSDFNSRLGKVVPGGDHFLWVISKGGYLEKFDLTNNTFQFLDILSGKTKQFLTCLLVDENGKLWIGTASGKLILYDSKSAKILRELSLPSPNNKQPINALYRDRDNRLWIIGSSISCLENNQIKNLADEKGVLTNKIIYSCIAEDNAGNLWVGSWGDGLFLKRKNHCCFHQFKGDTKTPLSSDLVIEAILTDHTGKIWTGTYGKGLFIINKDNKVTHLVNDKRNLSSLPFNDVLCIKQDANNGIWIGTDGGGISYYNENRSNFILFNEQTVPQNVEISLVRSIVTDKAGNIWAGTTNSGLTKIDYRKAKFKTWHFQSYKKNIYNPDRIVSLFNDKDDVIWMGTQGNGLILFDARNEKVIKWFHPESLPKLTIPDGTVWCMYPAAKDELWIGTGSNGLFLMDKKIGLIGKYKPDNLINGITDAIRAIVAINDTTLCIGFEKIGIKFFNTTSRTFFGSPSKKLTEFFNQETNIKSLYYHNSVLWIGTGGRGIFTYNTVNGKTAQLTDNDGLPNNTIYGILPAASGYLWISTNKGLSRFNENVIGAKPTPSQFTNYTATQGLQSNEFNTGAYYKSPDGTLLFGGINGLNLFDPSKFRDENKTVSVVFTKILVDNEPVQSETAAPFKKIVDLSNQNHSVAFNFAALDYFSSLQYHYYYQLNGFDKTWIDANQRNYVSYTNIPNGQYKFLVKYSKQGNIHGGTATILVINVDGPIWKKAWFICSLVVLFLVFVYGLYRYRKAQVFKLLNIRQRIATDLHDDIGSTLSNINILSTLSKKSLENPEQAAVFLDRIAEEVQLSSQSLDDIIWSINSHNDNWEETFSRMRRYTEEFFENTNTRYAIDLKEQAGTTSLKMEKRRDIFLIYKEILNNIHKHAAATEVTINMSFHEQRLIMTISDNGKGFDKTVQTHRNGLKNLNSRVARWKGAINIETNKAGTTIHISI